jgi:hypothetical protein
MNICIRTTFRHRGAATKNRGQQQARSRGLALFGIHGIYPHFGG